MSAFRWLRFKLSGYSRPGLDPVNLCERCYWQWTDGDWFPRRCRHCQPSMCDEAA